MSLRPLATLRLHDVSALEQQFPSLRHDLQHHARSCSLLFRLAAVHADISDCRDVVPLSLQFVVSIPDLQRRPQVL